MVEFNLFVEKHEKTDRTLRTISLTKRERLSFEESRPQLFRDNSQENRRKIGRAGGGDERSGGVDVDVIYFFFTGRDWETFLRARRNPSARSKGAAGTFRTV